MLRLIGKADPFLIRVAPAHARRRNALQSYVSSFNHEIKSEIFVAGKINPSEGGESTAFRSCSIVLNICNASEIGAKFSI